MEKIPELPELPASSRPPCPMTSSSSSSSSSRSPPDFLRDVRGVFKRQRAFGTKNTVGRARRIIVSVENGDSIASLEGIGGVKPLGHVGLVASVNSQKDGKAEGARLMNREQESLGTITYFDNQQRKANHVVCSSSSSSSSSLPPLVSSHSGFRREKFPAAGGANKHWTVDTGMEDMSSCLHTLALTEADNDLKPQDAIYADKIRSRVGLLDNVYDLRENQRGVNLVTNCSVVGSSCATTMSVHSCPTFQSTHLPATGRIEIPFPLSAVGPVIPNLNHALLGVQLNDEKIAVKVDAQKCNQDIKVEEGGKRISEDKKMLRPEVPLTINPSSTMNKVSMQQSKAEKVSRKKKYDPEVFFKVNGTLYQKLEKIGTGGSSEVHKVISSDCKIYALKKIKLKGREYTIAHGFCQEIEYLKKLKGKSNIIQLIDYEVTDKSLLEDVVNFSTANREGKIKDDEFIYMVLEYGEIDLAHMLSQKWEEIGHTSNLDENWLRFYWQQMLEAVNTIHEERIVHSDLKPANFLLVRGSLKLIDFGIAKAIMSDTTNIQRDAQVGTLNYMSPEAFMWNEHDASGNIIKCGRASDIWSLGCILYQMVYGKTPFAEYRTYWAKFKVISDKKHKISYEQVSNPWLIDLMRRCLTWDHNQRWRIPQLLKHPFLVPRVQQELTPRVDCDHQAPLPPCGDSYKLLMQKVERYSTNSELFSTLCSELHKLVTRLEEETTQSKNASLTL